MTAVSSVGIKLRSHDTQLMTSRGPPAGHQLSADEVQCYVIFWAGGRGKDQVLQKHPEEMTNLKSQLRSRKEETFEMGLQRLGFPQVQQLGVFISHSVLSCCNPAVASTSHSWCLHSPLLTARSIHLTKLFLQETFSCLGFQNTPLISSSVSFTDFSSFICPLSVNIY